MSDPASPTEARPRRRPLRRATHAGLWLVFAALVLVLLAGLAALILTDRRLPFPQYVTDRIEARLNADFEGGQIALGRIELAVDRSGVPRLWARNVDLRDTGGVGIARLSEVRAAFEPVALLRGTFAISRVTLTGAEVTLRRDTDGGFSLSFGQGVRSFAGLGGMIDAIEAGLDQPPFDTTERIVADGLTVVLEDARSGRVWQIFGGQLRLERGQDGLDATLWAEIFNQTEDLAEAQIALRSTSASGAAEILVRVDGVPARDIALQSPALAFLSVVDAPISGALRTALGEDGGTETLAGSLDIGKGALRPARGAAPIDFEGAQAYFEYDAAQARISFSEFSAEAEAVRFSATGHSYLREIGPGGWPGALVSQLRFSNIEFSPEGVFEKPVAFEGGVADLRFRTDPFRVDIGQLVLMEHIDRPEAHLRTRGRITADNRGWDVALDLQTEKLSVERALAIWPPPLAPRTRIWIAENVAAGRATGLTGGVRLSPGEPLGLAASFGLEGVRATALKGLPPITDLSGFVSIGQRRFALAVEEGRITPTMGGAVDLAGSSMVIPDMTAKPSRGEFEVITESSLTGLLATLMNPPINLFREGNGRPDLAEARAAATTRFEFPLGRPLDPDAVAYRTTGTLTGFVSDVLVPGRRLTAAKIDLEATPAAILAEGSALLDGVPVSGVWRNGLAEQERGRSELRGTIDLSQRAAGVFGLALPEGSLAGTARGEFRLRFAAGMAPEFVLTSDLRGLRARLAALGWTKPAAAAGRLLVEGRLGPQPAVQRLVIEGGGLEAEGAVDFAEGGAFTGARFDRVRIGGWLDAPVTLTSRGVGQPPAIGLAGGVYDMRNSTLGRGAEDGGARGPVDVALDRLVISEGIVLTNVRGNLEAGRALSGTVTGRVNGNAPIRAELAGGSVRITSSEGGAAIRDAGLLKNARGGALEMVLRPTAQRGTYDGRLTVRDLRVLDAPAMAELLNTLSLVGILDQLAGGIGIPFETIEANFRLTPDEVILYESSAVGASLGLSMDGRFDLGERELDMQGVISPLYLVNAIGSVFTRRGEGLIGINFTLTGPAAEPNVTVNPLSIFTPGMFREIFRRPAPTPD